MTPIFQTKFTNPSIEDEGNSNCLTACVASILERPLESIPEFGIGVGWFDDLYDWCMNEGIGLLYFTDDNIKHHGLCLNAYCILAYSVKGHDDNLLHAVVGKTGLDHEERLADGDTKWFWKVEVTHDPNPHGVEIETLKYFIFLIPPPSETILLSRVNLQEEVTPAK